MNYDHNYYRVTHINGICIQCGGTGLKVLHKQGDPVEESLSPNGFPNGFTITSRLIYASTLYTTCDCCTFKSTFIPNNQL